MNNDKGAPVTSIASWPSEIEVVPNGVNGIGFDTLPCSPWSMVTSNMLVHSFSGFGIIFSTEVSVSVSAGEIAKMKVKICCNQVPPYGWWEGSGGPIFDSYEHKEVFDNFGPPYYIVEMSGPISRFGIGFVVKN